MDELVQNLQFPFETKKLHGEGGTKRDDVGRFLHILCAVTAGHKFFLSDRRFVDCNAYYGTHAKSGKTLSTAPCHTLAALVLVLLLLMELK